VDFIIDIGGQDMKCFKIRRGGWIPSAQRGLLLGLRFVIETSRAPPLVI
jgi:hypothetical protein